MEKRFLLYIDILGFKELTKNNHKKIEKIYKIINGLQVHRDKSYETIIFSDTLLVYNKFSVENERIRPSTIMFLCEFAQDLMYRLAGTNVSFRAVISYGEFSDSKMKNLRAFYGSGLVDAYETEKSIPCTGLFLTNECSKYNNVFPMVKFNKNLNFVILFQTLKSLAYNQKYLPFHEEEILNSAPPYLIAEVLHLKYIYTMLKTHKDPDVRTKFLHTWMCYEKFLKRICQQLVNEEFNLETLSPKIKWSTWKRIHAENVKHYRSFE